MRASAAAARMLAPPPMLWPEAPNRFVSTEPNRNELASVASCSSHVKQCRRSFAKFWWLGKSPPSDSDAMTRYPRVAR